MCQPKTIPSRILDSTSGNIPGLIISPGLDLIGSCLPSRWVIMNWNPHKTSIRESVYFFLKLGCYLACKTKTMSPATVRLQQHGRHIAILIVTNAVINNSMVHRKGGELSSQLYLRTQSFGHAAFLSQYEPQEPSSCWLCSLGAYPLSLRISADQAYTIKITRSAQEKHNLHEDTHKWNTITISDPLHSGQTVSICWIMPNPTCLVTVLIPTP